MGWDADLASLTPIGSLDAGTAMTIKIGALRSAPDFAQRSPIGSGPKLAFTVLGWLARPLVSYVHNFNRGRPVRPLLHVRALAPMWSLKTVALAMIAMRRSETRAAPFHWALRCIASGSVRSLNSTG